MHYDEALERKADHAAYLAFRNALRLHYDAISLFKLRSYASALALSVLSMEEIAKAHLLEDIVFHSYANEMDSAGAWQWLEYGFFSHRKKHTLFAGRATYDQILRRADTKDAPKFYKLAQSGKLEDIKQAAFYVDFRRKKGLPFRSWPVHNPLRISTAKPRGMITLVNDYLLHLAVGHISDTYSPDSIEIQEILTPRFIRISAARWTHRGRIGQVALRKFRLSAAG